MLEVKRDLQEEKKLVDYIMSFINALEKNEFNLIKPVPKIEIKYNIDELDHGSNYLKKENKNVKY